MSVPYRDPWLDVVTFLTRTLEMKLFSKDNYYEVYRKQLKDHIVTVTIKIDEDTEGQELTTILNIGGENIWWHIQPYHSGYTLEYLTQFNEVDFVRVIVRNSIEFYDAWRDFGDF